MNELRAPDTTHPVSRVMLSRNIICNECLFDFRYDVPVSLHSKDTLGLRVQVYICPLGGSKMEKRKVSSTHWTPINSGGTADVLLYSLCYKC